MATSDRPLPAGLVQLLGQFDQIGVTGAQRLGQVGDLGRKVRLLLAQDLDRRVAGDDLHAVGAAGGLELLDLGKLRFRFQPGDLQRPKLGVERDDALGRKLSLRPDRDEVVLGAEIRQGRRRLIQLGAHAVDALLQPDHRLTSFLLVLGYLIGQIQIDQLVDEPGRLFRDFGHELDTDRVRIRRAADL